MEGQSQHMMVPIQQTIRHWANSLEQGQESFNQQVGTDIGPSSNLQNADCHLRLIL